MMLRRLVMVATGAGLAMVLVSAAAATCLLICHRRHGDTPSACALLPIEVCR